MGDTRSLDYSTDAASTPNHHDPHGSLGTCALAEEPQRKNSLTVRMHVVLSERLHIPVLSNVDVGIALAYGNEASAVTSRYG